MPIMMSCGVDEPDIPKLDATIMVNGTPFIISGVEIGIEDAQVGDVVIYNDDNGNKVHASTISETDGTFDGTLIFGRGGDDIIPSYLLIKDGYNRPDGHGNIVQTPTSHIHIYRPPEKDKKNDDNKENRERIHNENIQPL